MKYFQGSDRGFTSKISYFDFVSSDFIEILTKERIFCKSTGFMLSVLKFQKLNILEAYHHYSSLPNIPSVQSCSSGSHSRENLCMNVFIRAGCVCIFYQQCFVATASFKQTSQGAKPSAAALKQKRRYTDSCIVL